MTRLGFLLDSESCIGCHACTVACKAEHDVPIGVNRTWVKYIETGTFPDVGRHFSVMRCNHCDDAPCISICPTNALFRADNGVVDFDDDNCIGCKGCMNACPYDAIYINPATNTANKCNFCNHRIEQGLEPSCVVVCPTHAIKVADLDDPADEVTGLIARSETAVRAPEQNTQPKVYYRGADAASLDPLRTAIADDGMIWADTTAQHPTADLGGDGVVARTAYTTAHEMTWKAKVSSYLVTKAVAAGMMMVAALLVLLGHGGEQAAVGVVPPVVAGVFLALTAVLLVGDLKRPERFYYLITRGNRRSWLVKGAAVLGGFAAVSAAWFVAGAVESEGALQVLAAPAALLGLATAGYTAFLFAQCEGRDLWQSPLVLPTLLAQAVVAGGAGYAVMELAVDGPAPVAVQWVLLAGVLATAMLVAAELLGRGTPHVEAAVAAMARGRYARQFWIGGVALGLVVPAVLVAVSLAVDSGPVLAAVAGICAVAGMWCYEDSFVRAGQSVPLS
ncbi:4Fe-4S dicluster domain-containing protein [Candidatus Poriferisocius sp.]|uniref:4Fe-4S dicluster domain-containing protein n=1 Tax=Candidatus Poriferisocius sp. TaxID=3101276 RepID=UPI003B017B64